MKKFILIALVIPFVSGCMKDTSDPISAQDREATTNMRLALKNAKVYNDSLIYYFDPQIDGTPEDIQRCETFYQQYIDLFEHCHSDYSHDNDCDDHYHENGKMCMREKNGMNMQGGMCCGGEVESFDCHSEDEHETIDSIVDTYIPTDSIWDKSSVSVTGECVANAEACFTILNTGEQGEGNMDEPSNWRLYENNVLVQNGTFQLTGGNTKVLCFESSGNPMRLEADQRPGHPGNSHPNAVVEDCGLSD